MRTHDSWSIDATLDAGDVLALGRIAVRPGEVTFLVRLDLPYWPER